MKHKPDDELPDDSGMTQDEMKGFLSGAIGNVAQTILQRGEARAIEQLKGAGDYVGGAYTAKGYSGSFGGITNGETEAVSGLKALAPGEALEKTGREIAETYNVRGEKVHALNMLEHWVRVATAAQLPRHKGFQEAQRRMEAFEATHKTALEGQTDAQGGYAVPNIVGNEVFKLIRDASDVYGRARRLPMSSDTLSYPDEATAVTTYWSATDGTTLTAGEPVFGVKTLNARKLVGRATFSLELLDDANVAILPFLQSCFAEKMGGDLDFAAMEGTYAIATMPFTGVLNATSVGVYSPTTNGTIGVTLKYADMVKMFAAGGEKYTRDSGIWVMGPGVYANVIGMVDTNGQPIVKFGQVESAPSGSILGRPLVVSNRMGLTTIGAGTNSVGNLYFGPPSALVFGDRQGFRWDVSDQVNWAKYQADARMIGRFGYVVGVPTAWVRATGMFAK